MPGIVVTAAARGLDNVKAGASGGTVPVLPVAPCPSMQKSRPATRAPGPWHAGAPWAPWRDMHRNVAMLRHNNKSQRGALSRIKIVVLNFL